MIRSVLISLCLICTVCAIFTQGQPVSDSSSKNNNNAAAAAAAAAVRQDTAAVDQDSLPPDTFRKLAQALYQRGDKAENRLQRKFFYNDNVTCNDGSVAGFYIRRNYQSKRWVIFLEGKKTILPLFIVLIVLKELEQLFKGVASDYICLLSCQPLKKPTIKVYGT